MKTLDIEKKQNDWHEILKQLRRSPSLDIDEFVDINYDILFDEVLDLTFDPDDVQNEEYYLYEIALAWMTDIYSLYAVREKPTRRTYEGNDK